MRASRRFWFAWAAVMAVAAIAIVFRLEEWPSQGILSDIAMNATDALDVLESGPRLFFPRNGGREGLAINLMAISLGVFGVGTWQIRIPAALATLCGVGLTSLLGRKMWGSVAGIAAGLAMALSPMVAILGRGGWRASFLFAAIPLSLLLAMDAAEGKSYLQWGLAGAAAGLGFHFYIAWTVVPVVLAGWIAYAGLRGALSSRWVGYAAAWSSVAFAVGIPAVLSRLLGDTEAMSRMAGSLSLQRVWDGTTAHLLAPVLNGGQDAAMNVADFPWLSPAFALFAIAAIAISAVRPAALPRGRLVLAMAASGMLPAVLSGIGSYVQPMRAITMSVPVFLLAGAGCGLASSLLADRYGRAAGYAPLIVAAAMAFLMATTAVHWVGVNHSAIDERWQADTREAGLALARGEDLLLYSPPPKDRFTGDNWYVKPAEVFSGQAVIPTVEAVSPDLVRRQRVFCDSILWARICDGERASSGAAVEDPLPPGMIRDDEGFLYMAPEAR